MQLTGKTVAALRAKLKSARQRLLAKDTARPPGSWNVADDAFDPYAESSNISDSQLLHSHAPWHEVPRHTLEGVKTAQCQEDEEE